MNREAFRPGSHALLDELNDAQRAAVTHGGGPLLVLAGAGSGKTRVITRRVAYLTREVGVPPWGIVAVTFTNKAAAEMRERVRLLLGSDGFGGWIGTFHALCLRILRRDGRRIGLEPGFNIYDSEDQRALVKRVLKDLGVDPASGSPRSFLGRISRAKNALESPLELEKRAFTPDAKLRAEVYSRYETALRRANAVDFDDLLVRTLELFDRHEEVASGYASRCEHLLVDEYQDTNRPQYKLIRHLVAAHGNVCVVGDEDQSIYRFRGAEIRNILNFEGDHPGTCCIRLEQNYRSTATIIAAAGALIANNLHRKGKTLWTDNPRGDKVELFQAPDDRAEATWVSRRVREFASNLPYEDVAVLYRTNAQSRQLEEVFRRDRIPYQIVGSVQFYERKEIKDLLAYLKLAVNPADDVSFRRIVNTPARGIGGTTLAVVQGLADRMGLPLMESAGHALEQGLLASRSAKRLQEFLDFAANLTARADEHLPAEILQHVIEAVDFEAHLEKCYPGQGGDRMENVQSLVSAAAEYVEEEGDGSDLQGFLDRSALVSQSDEVGERPGVTLMTIHCAKGLEFPVVFLIGLEERLFPHAMSTDTPEEVEEERRLCYVAMTRARKRLLLSCAEVRRLQGAMLPNPPSRFLDEIPPELVEQVFPRIEGFFGTWERRRSIEPGSGGSSAARAARKAPPAPPRTPGIIATATPPADGFAIGATVQHPRFGGGRILDREGSGKHLKLTIHFSDHGPKKILPAYTKLQVQV